MLRSDSPGDLEPHEEAVAQRKWLLGHGLWLNLEKTRVVGILNVTPDSFFDGGFLDDPGRAVERGLELAAAGASMIDVGGESTRPGAPVVEPEEEKRRVLPVIGGLARQSPVPISVDTTKADVALAALEAGASVVNDVSGLTADPLMREAAASSRAGVVVMHIRGSPRTMRHHAVYDDPVADVLTELDAAVSGAIDAGVEPDRIVVDPGIGFAKTAEQSLLLLRHLRVFLRLGHPIFLGPSRKSFIGAVKETPVEERLPGTLAAIVAGVLEGARIIRAHDVAEAVQAVAVADAIRTSRL